MSDFRVSTSGYNCAHHLSVKPVAITVTVTGVVLATLGILVLTQVKGIHTLKSMAGGIGLTSGGGASVVIGVAIFALGKGPPVSGVAPEGTEGIPPELPVGGVAPELTEEISAEPPVSGVAPEVTEGIPPELPVSGVAPEGTEEIPAQPPVSGVVPGGTEEISPHVELLGVLDRLLREKPEGLIWSPNLCTNVSDLSCSERRNKDPLDDAIYVAVERTIKIRDEKEYGSAKLPANIHLAKKKQAFQSWVFDLDTDWPPINKEEFYSADNQTPLFMNCADYLHLALYHAGLITKEEIQFNYKTLILMKFGHDSHQNKWLYFEISELEKFHPGEYQPLPSGKQPREGDILIGSTRDHPYAHFLFLTKENGVWCGNSLWCQKDYLFPKTASLLDISQDEWLAGRLPLTYRHLPLEKFLRATKEAASSTTPVSVCYGREFPVYFDVRVEENPTWH